MCLSPFIYAEEIVIDKELKANFLRLNIVRNDVKIEHNETTSTPGFESLGRSVKFTENSLDFILGRELLRDWPISLSVYGVARLNTGSGGEQNATSAENLDYHESLSGFGAGAGASLNFNFNINDTRTQFYFSSQSVNQNNKYFLRYSNDDSPLRSTEIETIEESTIIQSGFGIRVYNLYNGYTFNVAVHHNDFTRNKINYKASRGSDNEFKLTSAPEFTRGNTAYSIGFGGTF